MSYISNSELTEAIMQWKRLRLQLKRRTTAVARIRAKQKGNTSELRRAKQILSLVQRRFKIAEDHVAQLLYLITSNIAKTGWVAHNLDVDEAVQSAVVYAFERLHKCDPRRGKVFNWLTTIIFNKMKQVLRDENNRTQLRSKYSQYFARLHT